MDDEQLILQTEGFTVEKYNALCAAIADGIKQVQYSDKMVTYRSLDEMLRVLQLMKEDPELFPPVAGQAFKGGRNVGGYYSGK